MPKLSNNLDPDLPKGVHVPPVPGIIVQILSQDKKAFPNYASPDKEPITEDETLSEYFSSRTVTTYLAVTNDTPFSIHLRVDRPYPMKMDCSMLQFEIFVDGKFVWNSWCHRPRYEGNGSAWEEILSGMKLGKGRSCEIKDFKFMGLKTNDACPSYTTFQRIRESMEKIGNIEIKVYRTMSGKKGGDVKNSKKGFLNKNSVEVPEKAIKGAEAKTHGTALDAGRKTTRGVVWRDARHHGEYPIAIFRFLYRSEEALKSLHIIDRTPTPSRASSPDSDSGLTAAQTKQMEDLMKLFRRRADGGGKSGRRRRQIEQSEENQERR